VWQEHAPKHKLKLGREAETYSLYGPNSGLWDCIVSSYHSISWFYILIAWK